MTTASTITHPDFSILGMFWQADFAIKIVMILLLIMSIRSWQIIISRILTIRRVYNEYYNVSDHMNRSPFQNTHIQDIQSYGIFSSIVNYFNKEWNKVYIDYKSSSIELKMLCHDRIMQIISIMIDDARNKVAHGISELQIIATISPFIGLFGTVWGIMSTIALLKEANLAVIAPGISEALFTTALGLLVAIPSYVAHGKLIKDVDNVTNMLENFAQEISANCINNITNNKNM